jgi:hypothetical protein
LLDAGAHIEFSDFQILDFLYEQNIDGPGQRANQGVNIGNSLLPF